MALNLGPTRPPGPESSCPITTDDAGPGTLALAVADANWFTTDSLFRELDRPSVSTLLLSCMDYQNALMRGRPPWSWRGTTRLDRDRLWRRELILPSGWMKRFPRIGMRPIAGAVRRWRRQAVGPGRLALVMTYPHYLFLREILRPDRSVYYNFDDYALYWPQAAVEVRRLEREAVRTADLTVCTSRVRAEELREAVPEAAAKVRHLPHGTPTPMLAAAPWHTPASVPDDLAHLPRPLLGYVGSMEDRVDWRLMRRLGEAFPGGTVVVVGRAGDRPAGAAWSEECREFLARPNVAAVGWRPQEALASYNSAFDVCLIPYRLDHPFNRACCPTKIMDLMGSGRPVVATSIPECRLYAHLFHVVDDADSFLGAVSSILDAGSDDGRATLRHDWARTHTCRRVADQLLDWLDV